MPRVVHCSCAIGYIGQQNNSVLGRADVSERFCGNIRPPALTSLGPRMVLVLNTHGAVRGGKFVARYKFIPGKVTVLFWSGIIMAFVVRAGCFTLTLTLTIRCWRSFSGSCSSVFTWRDLSSCSLRLAIILLELMIVAILKMAHSAKCIYDSRAVEQCGSVLEPRLSGR
jgi:hypothetical protein